MIAFFSFLVAFCRTFMQLHIIYMKKICPKYLVISNKSSNFAVDFRFDVIATRRNGRQKRVS